MNWGLGESLEVHSRSPLERKLQDSKDLVFVYPTCREQCLAHRSLHSA